MFNEQSNRPTYQHTENDNQQGRPPDRGPHRTQARQPGSRVTLARNIESSPPDSTVMIPAVAVARRGRCHSGISSGLA